MCAYTQITGGMSRPFVKFTALWKDFRIITHVTFLSTYLENWRECFVPPETNDIAQYNALLYVHDGRSGSRIRQVRAGWESLHMWVMHHKYTVLSQCHQATCPHHLI